MPDETTRALSSRIFYEHLEKSLAQARADKTHSLFEAKARVIAMVASEHLTAALEDPDPEAVLLAICDVAWAFLSPSSRPLVAAVMKALDTLGIQSITHPLPPPSGRWVARIGSRGRLTLPETLLYELGWKLGDTLLWEEVEPGRLSVRKVVHLNSRRQNRA